MGVIVIQCENVQDRDDGVAVNQKIAVCFTLPTFPPGKAVFSSFLTL